jgi:hypothetical protein
MALATQTGCQADARFCLKYKSCSKFLLKNFWLQVVFSRAERCLALYAAIRLASCSRAGFSSTKSCNAISRAFRFSCSMRFRRVSAPVRDVQQNRTATFGRTRNITELRKIHAAMLDEAGRKAVTSVRRLEAIILALHAIDACILTMRARITPREVAPYFLV